MKLSEVLALGFDNSERESSGKIRVGCSQCQAIVINGTPCHETGCQNEKHECEACEGLADKDMRFCDGCMEESY